MAVIEDEALRAELITFIEMYFWKHEKLPSLTHFKLKFHIDLVEEDLLELNEFLAARGILNYQIKPSPSPIKPINSIFETTTPLSVEEQGVLKEIEEIQSFDPRAVLAANLILNLGDKRSVASKLKALGLTTSEWEGFMNNVAFMSWYTDRVDKVSQSYSTRAKLGLGKLLEVGDLNTIKYWHEFSGEFKPQNEEVIHLKMIVSRMMEILSRFLTSDQLIQVADELEGITQANSIENQTRLILEAGVKND